MRTLDYGDPRLPERFWDKVIPEPMSGCWLWLAATDVGGYGVVGCRGKLVKAHRWMCAVVHGEPLPGDQTRHTCDTRSCVNPDHLLWGTPQDNTDDMIRRGRNSYASRTHCAHEHEFTEVNTRIRSSGSRQCRTCDKARAQTYRDRLVSQGLTTLGTERKVTRRVRA